MSARFDHLVVAVEDLDAAAHRWRAAGVPATRGGAHPVGTHNVLVRGPQPAYVELIAAGSEESNPWLDRVRSAHGPISWAIAVDDVEATRAAVVEAGFDPCPVTEGSRTTPAGAVVAWRMCDVGPGPYDGSLPFLIQWTTPMAPGPADGPVVEHVSLTPPDPERVADLLLALGFVPNQHWPRRMFHDADGLQVTLTPVGDPVGLEGASWYMGWSDDAPHEEPLAAVSFGVPAESPVPDLLDGVRVTTCADRRRFAAASLLPAVDEAFAVLRGGLADWPNPHPDGGPTQDEDEYSRCLDPGKYRLVAVRSDAWVEAIVAAGLGVKEAADPSGVRWLGEQFLIPSRVTVVRGRAGTQPLVVALAPSQGAEEAFLQVGVGEPAEVLERQPDCGCDACDSGSADLLTAIDNAFVLALSGGVYAVREGERVVRRSLNGWGTNDVDGDEADRWLAEAAAGRRTSGVVMGDAWL